MNVLDTSSIHMSAFEFGESFQSQMLNPKISPHPFLFRCESKSVFLYGAPPLYVKSFQFCYNETTLNWISKIPDGKMNARPFGLRYIVPSKLTRFVSSQERRSDALSRAKNLSLKTENTKFGSGTLGISLPLWNNFTNNPIAPSQ